MPEPDYDAPDVLVVSEPEQLRALGDEVRAKIVALLRERAWSTTELAEALGLPKGTVAHHVKVLERAGLIRVVRTRRVRAVTERFYGRVGRLFVFKTEDPADARALATASLRQAADDVAGAAEGATFGLVRARLRPEDAARLERRLERLLDDFRGKDAPEGELIGLSVAMWLAERRHA